MVSMTTGTFPQIRIDADGEFGPPSAAVLTHDDVWVLELAEGAPDVVTTVVAAARAAGFHVENLRWDGTEYVGSVCLIDTTPNVKARRRWWWQMRRNR